MRKGIVCAVVCLMVTIGLVACGGGGGSSSGGGTSNADVGGYWAVYFDSAGDGNYWNLTQNGGTLTGQYSCLGKESFTGTINNNTITISWQRPSSVTLTMTGTVSGSNIQNGTYTATGGSSGTWSAVKHSAVPTEKECVIQTAYAFCTYMTSTNKYYAGFEVDDPTALVQTANMSVSGIAGSAALTYNLGGTNPGVWLVSPLVLVSSGAMPPTFPLNYTLQLNFKDSTTIDVFRTVTSYGTTF